MKTLNSYRAHGANSDIKVIGMEYPWQLLLWATQEIFNGNHQRPAKRKEFRRRGVPALCEIKIRDGMSPPTGLGSGSKSIRDNRTQLYLGPHEHKGPSES